MKFRLSAAFALCSVLSFTTAQTPAKNLQCKLPKVNMPTEWITMPDPCTKKMREQIQEELIASMTYLAMGAHFSRDTINRPGFAKFFFDSASEEREHATNLLGYMLMRGGLTNDIGQLIRDPEPKAEAWDDAISALKDALKLETHVTKKIKRYSEHLRRSW